MAEYHYEAWSRTIGPTTGTITAGSVAEAKRLVGDGDTIVLDVAEATRTSLLSRQLRLGRASVRRTDVAWLARQLATTEKAGLPIKRALETIAAQRRDTAIGDVVLDICRRLGEGDDMAGAFGAHETSLGAITTALVTAGAASGTMAGAFEQLAVLTETQVSLRRKVKGALTYPSVVLCLSVVMTIAMLVFVVPTFQGLYAQLNGKLPLPTRVLVDVSHVLRRALWVGPLGALAAVLAYRSWSSQPTHAMLVDRAKMQLPVVGGLLKKAAVARVSATLGGLLGAGVTMLVALEMAAASAGLAPIEASLVGVGEDIRNGHGFASALADTHIWPDVMVQLVQVGEETGQLAELLNRYAKISQEEVAAEVDRVVNLIEPLMVVVIGAIVGISVVCLYLPLFDIVNLIK